MLSLLLYCLSVVQGLVLNVSNISQEQGFPKLIEVILNFGKHLKEKKIDLILDSDLSSYELISQLDLYSFEFDNIKLDVKQN